MDHGGMGGDGAACKISMLWNWNTVDACFLSETWQIKNDGMMAASCIGVMLLVVILEFFRRIGKEYDIYIARQFQRHVSAQTAASKAPASDDNNNSSCCAPPPVEAPVYGPQTITFRASPLQQLIRSVIHMFTFGIAYIVMLLAMYFNGYIIISIFLGAGIGKFFCDWLVLKVTVGGDDTGKGPSGIEDATICCG
ncbi:Ctr copper transporter family-domain-containing protein [Microdochium trichocladiopsis]|uniref:Copper transport protein n=1 Tax=Microdochium trichocladiopsis TaxID=1682393 RepID=A0A9P8Y8N4_9PEZI|nr:Ctr copper transporter family-domain-containing protein [Microdochium trichocladiopsis]KAH7032736.1 Ctr copper transporter family-domain-containing protein [Microdochium trichocladiopsis]